VTDHGEQVERLTYTIPEAARVLGIGRDLCYQLAHSGELRTLKMGRRILVPKTAVTELLEGTNKIGQQSPGYLSPGANRGPS
jgi:excisionase family DNA binding protein